MRRNRNRALEHHLIPASAIAGEVNEPAGDVDQQIGVAGEHVGTARGPRPSVRSPRWTGKA